MNEMRKLMETLERIDEGNENQAIVLAYDDGDENDFEDEGTRNLDIRGAPVSLQAWYNTMQEALRPSGGGYGEFEPRLIAKGLSKFPGSHDFTYTPAREGSVAVYVQGDPAALKSFGAFILKNKESLGYVNEVDYYQEGRKDISGPTLRLWWD